MDFSKLLLNNAIFAQNQLCCVISQMWIICINLLQPIKNNGVYLKFIVNEADAKSSEQNLKIIFSVIKHDVFLLIHYCEYYT